MSMGPVSNRSFHVHLPLPNHNGAPAAPVPRQFAVPTVDRAIENPIVPGLGWYIPCKRVCDLVLAVLLLIPASLFMLVGVILIKWTSRGPALYRQVRLGKGGRPFTLFKLRTMKHNAEAETGPVWSTENDCRITPVGKLLRTTHIDEFPQLFNVALGQMSLVGPRPERPEFVAKLDWEIPYYRERLKVAPGITGLAQLRLPPDATLDCVRRKVVHDVYYVRHVSPFLDAKLLCLTAWRLFKELYRFALWCVTLPSPDEVERGFRRAVGISSNEPVIPHVTLTSISSAGSAPDSDPEMVELQNAGE
jgi:lipopolysaccharide/colanic/teichoic acid biosynthesis glycosyltransferase